MRQAHPPSGAVQPRWPVSRRRTQTPSPARTAWGCPPSAFTAPQAAVCAASINCWNIISVLRTLFTTPAPSERYPGHDLQTSNKSISSQLICCPSCPRALVPRRHAEQISPPRFALTVSPCRLAFLPFPFPWWDERQARETKVLFPNTGHALHAQVLALNGWHSQGPFVCDVGLLVCQRPRLGPALFFSTSSTVALHICI